MDDRPCGRGRTSLAPRTRDFSRGAICGVVSWRGVPREQDVRATRWGQYGSGPMCWLVWAEGSASSALRNSRPPNGSRSPLARASLALVSASPASMSLVQAHHPDEYIRVCADANDWGTDGVRAGGSAVFELFGGPAIDAHPHPHPVLPPLHLRLPCTARMDGSYTATPGAGSVTQAPTLSAIPARPRRHLRGPCEPSCEYIHAFTSTQPMESTSAPEPTRVTHCVRTRAGTCPSSGIVGAFSLAGNRKLVSPRLALPHGSGFSYSSRAATREGLSRGGGREVYACRTGNSRPTPGVPSVSGSHSITFETMGRGRSGFAAALSRSGAAAEGFADDARIRRERRRRTSIAPPPPHLATLTANRFSRTATDFKNLFEPDKKHPLADFSCFLALKPEPSIVKTLKSKAQVLDERIAFDGSFGIPGVAVRSPTPSERDPLDDEDDEDDEDAEPAVPDKGKARASTLVLEPQAHVLPTNVASPIELSSPPMPQNGTRTTRTSLRRRRRPGPVFHM
ncbi:hypothetical protein B0H14DRAFT_3167656 [Mycena olivaceomarginata]|nr:hypothetical protein B0H14DRAFT_3167656 [Mycena olivaceomarginata]